tara:strand:- start:682 stop:924 length:243 start_codon:yes stop_codon:yes gene_type:complete
MDTQTDQTQVISELSRKITRLCGDADTQDKIDDLRLFQQNINATLFGMLQRAEANVRLRESDENEKIQKKYEALKAIFND